MKRVSLSGWVCPEQEGLVRSNPSNRKRGKRVKRKRGKGPFGKLRTGNGKRGIRWGQ
jgi:hypothetical protein